ncbi:MAG: ATP-binding protein [Spirochaetia bacterium]
MMRQISGRSSLQVVITAVFGVLLTVMACLTWFFTFRNGQVSILELAAQMGRQSMLNIRSSLEDYVAEPKLVNEINFFSFEQGDTAAFAQDRLTRRFLAQLLRYPSTVSIAYATERGEYIGVSRGIEGVPLALGICDQATGGFLEGYRIDALGHRQERFDRSTAPFDPRPRPWYVTAIRAGAPAWTPIYLWVTGDAGLDSVTPIRDGTGRLMGVLDTSLTLSGIGSFLQSVKATPHSEAFILERTGMLVGASSITTPYRHSGDQIQRINAVDSDDSIIRASARTIMRAVSAKQGINEEVQFAFPIDGNRRTLRVAPFRDGHGLDWLIAESIPESDLAQNIYRDMRTTAVFVALFLLLSMGIALLLARRIGVPLRLLSELAHNFAKGELDSPIAVQGTGEVAQLADSFNAMREELRASFGSLAQSEARYRALFEDMPVGLFRTDASGNIEQANVRMRAMFGFSETDSLSALNAFSLLNNPGDRERLRDMLQQNGSLQDTEVEMVRPDGATFWARAHVRLVRDTPDGVTHYEGSMVDVTERKRMEEHLRQSQKIEAIGLLAGGIAHDFNNILAAEMMNLELLQENPHLDREAHDVVKELKAEAARAASLTRQLLTFGRRSVLQIRPLNLNVLVANLLQMLGRLLGERITLAFERESTAPSVEADGGMMEQVLVNLAVNARDAMPQGGRITISIETVEMDPARAMEDPNRSPGRFVCLSVRDTGSGMDAGTLKRIFEPFFTTKSAGTGLGLATVHGIVAQHRGWVEVESEVGTGTTFRIYLPASLNEEKQVSKTTEQPVSPGRETLLVVEDDENVRRLLVKALGTLGYRVLEASNGQQAMTLWRTQGRQIDLLLTDMMMPEGMTGLELAEEFRKDKPGLKIIISSGYSAEVSQLGKATAEGIVYLPKPYHMAELGAALRLCLDRR